MVSDPLFEAVYNERILRKLKQQFGPFARQHADLTAGTEVMQRMLDKMAKKERRGEVVMVIPNEHSSLWVHTKHFYPEGVYRLMTGGLEPGEKPDQALRREVNEETGFQTQIDRCLAVLTYTIAGEQQTLPFVSYVFLTTATSGSPHPRDQQETITDFRAVPVTALAGIARRLRNLSGKFADWGAFRAIAHETAQVQLQAE